MEIIYLCIKNALYVALISTVVELLLPNTTIKKYARFVLGLILLSVLLSPIQQGINIQTQSSGQISKVEVTNQQPTIDDYIEFAQEKADEADRLNGKTEETPSSTIKIN